MVEPRTTSCAHCNKEIPLSIVWCVHCGERTRDQSEQTQGRSQQVEQSQVQAAAKILERRNQDENNTTVSHREYSRDSTQSIAMGNWSIAPLIGSILGALVLIFGVLGGEGSPQQAAAAAIGVGLAAIPYVFARAISELQAGNK